jgi:DNA-binding response OmpR family regulator
VSELKASILVVEDEKDISELIGLHLRREGHEVTAVENGEEALGLLNQNQYSLVVLDWMLPGLSGLELCKKIRAKLDSPVSSIPIFMVTARAHSSDIVVGLEMGADDYITKPFEIPVFLARVRALLRRANSPGESTSDKFEIGELKVDQNTYQVTCARKDIQLTPSEFKLLLALVRNRGRVLTRERLIDLVQGEGVTVVDRTIDTHIFGLRKKLGKCADVVETIRGVGYRVKDE